MARLSSVLALSALALLGCPSSTPGPQGPEGAQGPRGPAGPQGPQGERGPPGEVLVVDGGVVTGPAGPRGASVVMTVVAPGGACATGGVQLTLEDGGAPQVICNGATGPAGPQGATGAAGASAQVTAIDGGACPTGGVRVEVPGGAPVFVCNGQAGAAGPQGAAGPTGPQGPMGAQGVQGATGATGPAGPQGPQGPAGTSVALTALSTGDTNCPYGGTRLTAGTTIAFACNGAPGPQGPPGQAVLVDGGALSSYVGDRVEGFTFAGYTAVAYTGALGGTAGANQKCHAEFAGSHLCNDHEYQLIGTASPIPAAGAWVDYGQWPSSSSPSPHLRDRYYGSGSDCAFWTSSASTDQGFALDVTGRYNQTATQRQCNLQRPLACCRGPVNWFRGYTATAWNGALGGLAGANQKCHAEFAGSHFCNDREFAVAGTGVPIPVAGAWVDYAQWPSSSAPTPSLRDRYFGSGSDCSFWTSGASTDQGFALDVTGRYNQTATQRQCSVQRPLACCGP
ncbi:MAG: hypothetical protein ACOZQL_20110 [Myxococcota bacterium]